ncbi:hypothetical protein G6F59_017375 [Rhizopus arrhizus]|nr:hypothetical protein G6F59_017375 [Rhizopus arrhizus]
MTAVLAGARRGQFGLVVQVPGAGDMAGVIGLAAGRVVGQVMAHIEHAHVGRIEARGQIGGGNQCHRHSVCSWSKGARVRPAWGRASCATPTAAPRK